MSGIDSIIDKLASASVDDEKEISFAGRGMKMDSEEDAAEIVQAIKSCPGMTSLRLEGNTIGIQAAKAIAKALESQPSFRRALWKDMFTQRTEREIPDALNYLSSGITLANAQLVELDLSDNAFGPRGLKGIVNLLKSAPCYTLKELRLNNNGLGISGAKMLAAALSQCLANSRADGRPLNLKLFICGRNRLENEGSLALAVFLKDIGTLEYIAMPQNGIYYEGIIGLSAALAANTNLKYLSLEDNSLTEKGAEAIAKYLPGLEKLETINFGDCLIRTEGAKSIANGLQGSCPNLRELFLGYNEITTEGGLAVVDSLRNKQCLEQLVLNGNQFGEKGCELIKERLIQCGKISDIISLVDDEGSEVEEDEENETSEESEDDAYDVPETTKGRHQSPMKRPMTVADFVAQPTSQALIQLYKTEMDLLSTLPDNPCLRDYFDLFMKISSVVKLDDEETEKAACYYADIIFEKAYSDFSGDNIWTFNNELVVTLGFLKDEDGKKCNIDLTLPFTVLKHVVRQKYFHITTKDLLQLFLSRPLSCDLNSKVKHALLQALYQT